MNDDIIEALEEVKMSVNDSVNDVESQTGWVQINTSDALDKLDEILKVLKKIERNL